MATIGLAQVRAEGAPDLPLLTAGNDVVHIANFLRADCVTYSAAEVIADLLA